MEILFAARHIVAVVDFFSLFLQNHRNIVPFKFNMKYVGEFVKNEWKLVWKMKWG